MTTEKRFDPVDKKLYAKEEFRSFYSGEAEWDAAEVERRVDPADGKKYTMREFTSHYGGTAKWEKAAEEHRIDPHDGKAYTKEEFVACYKVLENWETATPVGQATARTPPPVSDPAPATPKSGEKDGEVKPPGGTAGCDAASERRIDPSDGKAYTKEEFLACYKVLKEWDTATPTAGASPVADHEENDDTSESPAGCGKPLEWEDNARTPPPVARPERRIATDGKAYTKTEFVTHYVSLDEWDVALSADNDGLPSPPPPEEKRVAKDGKPYTKKEFLEYFKERGPTLWDAARPDEKKIDGPAPPPLEEKRVAKDNKQYTRTEFLEFYKDQGPALWEAAGKAPDAWDAPPPEKRMALDGKPYTNAEFTEFYGSRAMSLWYAAKPMTTDALHDPAWGKASSAPTPTPTPEKRKARDGKMYTQKEFKDFYGDSKGPKVWDAAGTLPAVSTPAPTTVEPVKRRARDGKMYTQKEFMDHDGAPQGRAMWDAATTTSSPTPAATSPVLRTATLGQEEKVAKFSPDWMKPVRSSSKPLVPSIIPKKKDNWQLDSLKRTRSEKHGEKQPPAQVAKKSNSDSESESGGGGHSDGDSGSDCDKKPRRPLQLQMISRLPSDKRAIHKRASAKEGRNKKMKFYYRAYTAEEALLWEVRAALAGPCLRFSPEKAVLPTCDGEWKCKTLVGALGDVKSAGAGISALPTKVTELLNKAGLGQYAPHVLRSAQSRNVAAAGVLQVGVTHDVAADIEVDRDAETMVLRPKVVGVLQKRKVWLSPFPLATSCDRANFHQDLQSTLLSALHPQVGWGATGGATQLRNATQAILGFVPKWWDASKCTASTNPEF